MIVVTSQSSNIPRTREVQVVSVVWPRMEGLPMTCSEGGRGKVAEGLCGTMRVTLVPGDMIYSNGKFLTIHHSTTGHSFLIEIMFLYTGKSKYFSSSVGFTL